MGGAYSYYLLSSYTIDAILVVVYYNSAGCALVVYAIGSDIGTSSQLIVTDYYYATTPAGQVVGYEGVAG